MIIHAQNPSNWEENQEDYHEFKDQPGLECKILFQKQFKFFPVGNLITSE